MYKYMHINLALTNELLPKGFFVKDTSFFYMLNKTS